MICVIPHSLGFWLGELKPLICTTHDRLFDWVRKWACCRRLDPTKDEKSANVRQDGSEKTKSKGKQRHFVFCNNSNVKVQMLLWKICIALPYIPTQLLLQSGENSRQARDSLTPFNCHQGKHKAPNNLSHSYYQNFNCRWPLLLFDWISFAFFPSGWPPVYPEKYFSSSFQVRGCHVRSDYGCLNWLVPRWTSAYSAFIILLGFRPIRQSVCKILSRSMLRNLLIPQRCYIIYIYVYISEDSQHFLLVDANVHYFMQLHFGVHMRGVLPGKTP